MFILEKTGVASVPDEAFFHKPGNSQFVRFCFAKEDNELDVLEVACGGGIGLGYLARTAKKVVGGDIDETILQYPRDYNYLYSQ